MRSLQEIEENWSIDDLLEASIALDIWDDMERRARAKVDADANCAPKR